MAAPGMGALSVCVTPGGMDPGLEGARYLQTQLKPGFGFGITQGTAMARPRAAMGGDKRVIAGDDACEMGEGGYPYPQHPEVPLGPTAPCPH